MEQRKGAALKSRKAVIRLGAAFITTVRRGHRLQTICHRREQSVHFSGIVQHTADFFPALAKSFRNIGTQHRRIGKECVYIPGKHMAFIFRELRLIFRG